jgi:hypothetical protein
MWFLAILVLFNAWANNADFVNAYRLNIFGMPANPIDGLIVLGFAIALIKPQGPSFVKTERMHPAVMWMLGLFVLATLGGLIGASYNGANNRQIITSLRNFLAAPAALYLAYFLTNNIHSSRRYLYIVMAAGVIVSFMIVVFFKEKTETRTFGEINQVRAIAYISVYAGIAVGLLFYSLAAGVRPLPLVIAWGVMGACIVGQFATLSRSDWLACWVGLCAAFLLLPKSQWMKSLGRAALAVPVLVVSLIIGMHFGTQISGKDLFKRFKDRTISMLPGDRPGVKGKAWDTRLPGTLRELRFFASSPLIGGGFAIQDTPQAENAMNPGLRHNSWSGQLAETGLLGFGAFAIMAGSMIVVGRRMVRDRTDQTTVLIGALGVITGLFFIIHGLATMSFNQVRGGLPMFITAGVVLRTRQVQLQLIRQAQEEQAYLMHTDAYEHAMYPDGGGGGGGIAHQEPALGQNWYQTN